MEPKKKNKEPDTTTIAYYALGAVIVCLITLFGISSFLRLNNIIVEGFVIYTPEQIAQASNASKGDNLLYLNKQNTSQRIREELPYISTVVISKEFPDILKIEVTESSPIAYIAHAGDALVVDSTGRVLDVVKPLFGTAVEIRGKKLIEIRGVPVSEATPGNMPVIELGSETSFTAMQDILAVMEREGASAEVNYLDVANITNISFGYLDKYRVIIGGLRDFRHKITNLPSMISRVQERYGSVGGTLSLTNPSGEYSFLPD